MDHIRVLKRAFHIVWQYRALWLIGLLLVLAGGGVTGGFSSAPPGGSSSGGGRGGDGWEREWDDWPSYREFSDLWEDIAPIVITVAIIVAALVLLAVLIGVVKVIARYVTRTSLVQMVDRYEESGEKVGFWDGLRLGWSRSAVHLFLISLALKLPLALLMILLIGSLVTLATFSFIAGSGPMIVLGIVLVLLVIPIGLFGALIGTLLGPIIELSYRACAIEKVGAGEAIGSALGLIRRNLGATALQWLLLVGLGIAWGIVLIPVNLLLVVLGLFVGGLPALLFGGLSGLATGPLLGVGIGVLVFIPVFLVVVVLPNVAFTTAATIFHSTTWTLTYRELKAVDGGLQETRVVKVEESELADISEE